MASISDDSDDNFSDYSQFSEQWDENSSEKSENVDIAISKPVKTTNLVSNIINRQLYGRFTKNPKAKTERIFNTIYPECRFVLASLLKEKEYLNHVFMGFTMCGQYILSYTHTVKISHELGPLHFTPYYNYELQIWRFVPGQKLIFHSKHKIFKHLHSDAIDTIKFLQFPGDLHRLVCYGVTATNFDTHITILTLPAPKNCRHCCTKFTMNESVNQGWCNKHGFIIHCLFSMALPAPVFDPNISLAYPNHLIIDTGYQIHIINVSTTEPTQPTVPLVNLVKEEEKLITNTPTHTFNDTLSEVSETPSEQFDSGSIFDAILEDFSEYDMESNECNKPFHELNISCEPLNVTGKSYHNTMVQNIVDPRVKRLQGNSTGVPKSIEKPKIDKKIAEKCYDFIEENEKYEKISSFRKKRLAEKKYEFSEDNNENIVPFNSLRRERRFMYKSQTRCIRSPDFNSIFLSPRSPMQSPKSRSGQFSPSGARNLYCPSARNSPHHSKSPISPKEGARKFYVYSPSLDSDCSDSDSRLIMRTGLCNNVMNGTDSKFGNTGLLIVDPKTETPKWIRKVVRRFSNGDFENGSLVSGQSRDDYNISIEIPLIVQNLTEQQLDIVPDYKSDTMTETQLIVTQRSFDCEQFVQRRAQQLCSEAQLEYSHCQDYDIKIIHVCPINGHIICHAIIKIGVKKNSHCLLELYAAKILFMWSIESNAFDVIDNKESIKPLSADIKLDISDYDIPRCREVTVMDCCFFESKKSLRDCNNYYEICLQSDEIPLDQARYMIRGYSSDSD